MTDKEIVERAKEAEKRTHFGKLVHSPISKGVNSAYGIGYIEGMVEYRNSLQKEPASEDLDKEITHYLLYEHRSQLNEIMHKANLKLEMQYHKDIENAFKAGAKWQKEQDKQWLAEEHKNIFAKGRESMKQQMMKDAVEREVKIDAGGYPYINCNIELYDYDKDIPLAKKGDKVKLIII